MSEQTGSGGGLNEYIQHHLTQNTIQLGGGGFHIDTWAVSLILGLFFIAWFGFFARRATAGDVRRSRRRQSFSWKWKATVLQAGSTSAITPPTTALPVSR